MQMARPLRGDGGEVPLLGKLLESCFEMAILSHSIIASHIDDSLDLACSEFRYTIFRRL